MGLGYRKGAARRLRKTGGLVFWTVACSVVFVVCGRMLWLAYTTLWANIPLRRSGGPWVLLEQEPLWQRQRPLWREPRLGARAPWSQWQLRPGRPG